MNELNNEEGYSEVKGNESAHEQAEAYKDVGDTIEMTGSFGKDTDAQDVREILAKREAPDDIEKLTQKINELGQQVKKLALIGDDELGDRSRGDIAKEIAQKQREIDSLREMRDTAIAEEE